MGEVGRGMEKEVRREGEGECVREEEGGRSEG